MHMAHPNWRSKSGLGGFFIGLNWQSILFYRVNANLFNMIFNIKFVRKNVN